MWNIAVGLFVVMLWAAGMGLILGASSKGFNLALFLELLWFGVAILGSALAVFCGLRLLVRTVLTWMNLMQKGDRWLGLDMSIGLFAAVLWSVGVAFVLSDNDTEFAVGQFVERTLIGTVAVGFLFGLFFGLRALAYNKLPPFDDRLKSLDVSIGIFTAILWAFGTGVLFGESGTEFNRAFIVGRILLGIASLGGVLLLFFRLRVLARIVLRGIGFANRFAWLLDIATGLFVAIFWAVGVTWFINSGTEFDITYFAVEVLRAAMSLGCALLLFFGLRALARMGLRKVDFARSGTGATSSID